MVNAVTEAIGKEKTGIRLSPYGVANDMSYYSGTDVTYKYLAEHLDRRGIVYIHILDHSARGAPPVPMEIKKMIRDTFKNTIILAGGYDKEKAEDDLENGLGDLIAFGRPFINNPDFVERLKNGWPLSNDADSKLFYSPGEKGYTDYPVYKA